MKKKLNRQTGDILTGKTKLFCTKTDILILLSENGRVHIFLPYIQLINEDQHLHHKYTAFLLVRKVPIFFLGLEIKLLDPTWPSSESWSIRLGCKYQSKNWTTRIGKEENEISQGG